MRHQPGPIADGLVYHALNRGNNRAQVFFSGRDYLAFLEALAQTQCRYPFLLFGYCLMSNHFHLLLAPEKGQSISRILQSLTVAHSWRYHRVHATVGHVWQGRFRSPLIQDDAHSLTVLRYVEANPLRGRMVADLASYHWSSYRAHGMGQADPLVRVLPAWELLGRAEPARQGYWRTLVHTPLSERELAAVRQSVVTGRPFGQAGWAAATAAGLGLRTGARPRGRPRKAQDKASQDLLTERVAASPKMQDKK